MKKETAFRVLRFSALAGLMAGTSLWTSCNQDEPSIEVCGENVSIEKKENEFDNSLIYNGTHYDYTLNTSELNSKENYIIDITATFKSNLGENQNPDLVLQQTIETKEYVSGSSLFRSYEEPISVLGKIEHLDLSSGSAIPSFVTFGKEAELVVTLAFTGECEESTETIETTDLEVTEVIEGGYFSSILLVSSNSESSTISTGSPIAITLISNNQSDSNPEVIVTTSLGETETVSLSNGSASLPTVLSSSKGTDEDGTLNIEAGTTVTFAYNKNLNENDEVSPTTIEIDVTGDDAPIEVTSIVVSGDNTVQQGGTIQLSAVVSPSDATDKSVTWSSSNTSVATINSSGLVTAVSPGSSTIKATANDGSEVFGEYPITVTAPSDVTFNGQGYDLAGGDVTPTNEGLG